MNISGTYRALKPNLGNDTQRPFYRIRTQGWGFDLHQSVTHVTAKARELSLEHKGVAYQVIRTDQGGDHLLVTYCNGIPSYSSEF